MGRWRRHLDPKVKRDAWSTREDRHLTELHHEHGSNWSAIAKTMKNRTAQQCRARWFQAHFTGHRYLDISGNLLTPRAREKAEKEVELAKALAAEADKTLRPNGSKSETANTIIAAAAAAAAATTATTATTAAKNAKDTPFAATSLIPTEGNVDEAMETTTTRKRKDPTDNDS